MMKVHLKSDLSLLDKVDRNIVTLSDKTMGQAAESIIDRIQKNWSMVSPSSPGEPPAIVSGTLSESISTDNAGRNALGQFATAENAVAHYIRVMTDYALALEFGYAARNLDPRPYMLPAIMQEQSEIGDKFAINFGGLTK